MIIIYLFILQLHNCQQNNETYSLKIFGTINAKQTVFLFFILLVISRSDNRVGTLFFFMTNKIEKFMYFIQICMQMIKITIRPCEHDINCCIINEFEVCRSKKNSRLLMNIIIIKSIRKQFISYTILHQVGNFYSFVYTS